MSIEVEMLGIGLDTSGLKAGQSELKRTADAGARAADALDAAGKRGSDGMDKIEGGAGRARSSVESLAFGVGSLRNILGALGLIQASREFVQTADSMSLMESRIRLTMKASDDYSKVQRDLLQIANSSRVGLTDLGALYGRLVVPIERLGGGQREAMGITDALSKALLIGGANAQEASSAIIQFSQAMASGVLRGDEFNSIAEAAPPVMRALESALHKTSGEIRQMAAEGQLTAGVVGNVLLSSLGQFQAQAAAIKPTVEQTFTVFKNELSVAIQEVNNATGATAELIERLSGATHGVTDFVHAWKDGNLSEQQKTLIGIAGAVVGLTTAYVGARTALLLLNGAQAAFNALAAKNPYVIIASALLGVTAAIVGYNAAQQEAKTDTEKLVDANQLLLKMRDQLKTASPSMVEPLKAEMRATIERIQVLRKVIDVKKEDAALDKAVAESDATMSNARAQGYAKLSTAVKPSAEAIAKAAREALKASDALAGLQREVDAVNMSGPEKEAQKLAKMREEFERFHPTPQQLASFDQLTAKLLQLQAAKAGFEKQSGVDDKYLEAAGIPSGVIALLNDKKSTVGDFSAQNSIDTITASTKAATDAAEKAKQSFDSFMSMDVGTLGAGFDRVTQSMSTVGDQFGKLIDLQEKYAQARKDNSGDAVKLAQLDLKHDMDQIRSYGNLAGAAKNFFKEGSSGYKALQTAEQAFRVYELAMNAKVIAEKLLGITAVTTAKVAGDATQGASGAALSVTELASTAATTSAKAVKAVVSSISDLPFPVNLAAGAATIGFLASLGVNLAGGGKGGGNVDPGNTGTGTVFGDSSKPSESIKKSIDLLAGNSKIELSYSAAMLASLRGIEANIGGLTNLLVRLPGVGSLASTVQTGFKEDAIGKTLDATVRAGLALSTFGMSEFLGLGKTLGKIVGGLFGSKTKITGQGLFAPSQQLGDILSGGFDLYNYVDVNTKKKSFGLTTSSKDSTITSEADQLLQRQFGQVFQGFNSAIRAAAGPLKVNLDVIDTRLSDFVVSIGKINLQGLSGEQIQERLQAVFGAAADSIAARALPGLDDFQKVGEGYFETVTRVAAGVEESTYLLERLHVTAIRYGDVVAKQGDVGAEIVRQSLQAYEQATYGLTTGVSQIISTFDGSAQEISDVYRSMLKLRDGLSAVGKVATSLTVDMIRGAGGAEALQSGLDSYFSDYLTDGERTAELSKRMTREFAALGLALPTGKDGFKSLVAGIDVSTSAGQELFGSVINLAGGFSELQNALNAAADAQNKLKDALAQERYSGLLPEQQLSDLQAKYDAAYAIALVSTGDQLQKQSDIMAGLLDPLLKQAANVYASGEQYQAIRDYTLRAGDNIVGRVPGFASGGMFGGGLRLVGERGPELEVTGPARYWNANQTQSMLSGGGDQSQVIAELRQQNTTLTAMVRELQALVRVQSAGNQQILESLEEQGESLDNIDNSSRLQALA